MEFTFNRLGMDTLAVKDLVVGLVYNETEDGIDENVVAVRVEVAPLLNLDDEITVVMLMRHEEIHKFVAGLLAFVKVEDGGTN